MNAAIESFRRAVREAELLQGQIDTISAAISDRESLLSQLQHAETTYDAHRLHDELRAGDHPMVRRLKRVRLKRSLHQARLAALKARPIAIGAALSALPEIRYLPALIAKPPPW